MNSMAPVIVGAKLLGRTEFICLISTTQGDFCKSTCGSVVEFLETSVCARGEAAKVALFFSVSQQTKMIFCYCFNHVNQLLAIMKEKNEFFATVILY